MDHQNEEEDNQFHQDDNRPSKTKLVYQLIRQAIPGSLCQMVMLMQGLINVAFAGHLDNPTFLSGVGMGNCIQNIVGMSIVAGLNMAFDTLSS